VDRFAREEFLKQLRDDLTHLYEADHLRASPLASLFGVANRFDTSTALRNIFTESIQSLKPKDDTLSCSRAWWVYDSLFCCFVQQLTQQVVADQLAISPRQLRRGQRTALEALADQLWERFNLETKLPRVETTADDSDAHAVKAGLGMSEELAWLKDTPVDKPTDLNDALLAALDLLNPLATQHRVRLETETTDALPGLAVHPVALSQILISLLSVAISRTTGGHVRIAARRLSWEIEIDVQGTEALAGDQPISDDDVAALDTARQLLQLCGGTLPIWEAEQAFSAKVRLPALDQLPVLVIDDNPDTLPLLQRYTTGTRYRLVSTRDPEQALPLAESISPQIIVLDVMMPQVDGWKVLGRLRQHPLTGHIPIVVCTILAQEALALSLGASAFVRKPVTRQAFLGALDDQTAKKETEHR